MFSHVLIVTRDVPLQADDLCGMWIVEGTDFSPFSFPFPTMQSRVRQRTSLFLLSFTTIQTDFGIQFDYSDISEKSNTY